MSENPSDPKQKGSRALYNKNKEVNKIETPPNLEPEIIIPEEVKPILKKLPPEEKNKMVSAMVGLSVNRTWTGPIPPPDILAGYNDIIPDGAERILRMAEKQSDHRILMESTVINRELNQSGRGQNYAVFIVILVLIASFILVYTNHDVAGGVLGAVDLVALASVFVIGKYTQKKDLAKKKN